MKNSTARILALWSLAIPSLAWAQFSEPPSIVVVDAERTLDADVMPDSEQDSDLKIYTASGPWIDSAFAETVGEHASTGTAEVAQETDISAYSIRGDGSASAISVLGNGPDAEITVGAASTLVVEFTMPVAAPYSLSGSFTAEGESGGICLAGGSVGMTEVDINSEVHFLHDHSFNCDDPKEDATFLFFGTVGANSTIFFSIGASAFGLGNQFVNNTGNGDATFTFTLDFGDRDGDGLLDAWEKNGIDFPGPGVEIDLPGMGANPDKKDLFVEIDVMEAVGFDQAAIDDVIEAFAYAPASMVDNPDGTLGIQLHVVTDGDRPPFQAMIIDPNIGIPPEYYTIKDSFFGSEDLRNHPAWDDIRRASLLIFRYCLWADTAPFPLPLSGGAFGIAEGIPSNDLIIAAGDLVDSYPDTPSAALSATFMHELGHTLGLGHGGQNNENRKPNYLSVMNYAYTLPFTTTTAQGTNVADYWRLDYSRKAMIDLDETELYETEGLLGPAGRFVYYNSAEESDPDPVVRAVWWANKTYVDWNGNGGTPKPDWYDLDITRNDASVDPDYDSSLESFTDWDRLWYHLAGTDDFNDRRRWPFAAPAEGLDVATIQAFQEVDWVDLTALGDLVFENGFELGSTTAWSETVP